MDINQQYNAVSRSVIVLTLLTYLATGNLRLLVTGAVMLFTIYIVHKYSVDELAKKEGFDTNFVEIPAAAAAAEESRQQFNNNLFQPPDPANPMANILLTDYDFNPNKRPAGPAYTKSVSDAILASAKQLVADINHEQPDIVDRLFKDLGEELSFEQSMRQYTSNPNTIIPNDRESFQNFLYGSMVSCKEGDAIACDRNNTNYNLY